MSDVKGIGTIGSVALLVSSMTVKALFLLIYHNDGNSPFSFFLHLGPRSINNSTIISTGRLHVYYYYFWLWNAHEFTHTFIAILVRMACSCRHIHCSSFSLRVLITFCMWSFIKYSRKWKISGRAPNCWDLKKKKVELRNINHFNRQRSN
jgi:hypothetical protein